VAFPLILYDTAKTETKSHRAILPTPSCRLIDRVLPLAEETTENELLGRAQRAAYVTNRLLCNGSATSSASACDSSHALGTPHIGCATLRDSAVPPPSQPLAARGILAVMPGGRPTRRAARFITCTQQVVRSCVYGSGSYDRPSCRHYHPHFPSCFSPSLQRFTAP
jgi:hypothetical protein